MRDETVEELRKQHVENYRKAILENIRNNTNVLVDEDITSLIRKPPLDSMDLIKSKFLDLAKRNKIVLDTLELDKILDAYRENISESLIMVKNIRIEQLSSKVNDVKLERESDVIKVNKKDFTVVNKQIRKFMKEKINESYSDKLLKNVDKIFISGTSDEIKNKVIMEVTKYFNGSYQKQLFEGIDFKILVKDTTLINGILEQGERYLFTKNNSHLFDE